MQEKLKVALLGVKDASDALLDAIETLDYFQVQAVADTDTHLAEKTAARYNCTAFDDYRQLVIQNQLDCLIVAAGMYACDECVRAAMKKKFHILKIPPMARNFAEATEFVSLAKQENIRFAVASLTRFAGSFAKLQTLLSQNLIEQLYLVSALCRLPGTLKSSWQTDPRLAGGGIILRECSEIIGWLTINLGLPRKVYALTSNGTPDKQQRLYLAEDTAVVTMKFAENLIANLVASSSPADKGRHRVIKLYTSDKIFTVSDNQLLAYNTQDNSTSQFDYADDEISLTKKMLENFARSILSPDKNRLFQEETRELNNMAVVEAAYLSARTTMPEEPTAILQMASITPS